MRCPDISSMQRILPLATRKYHAEFAAAEYRMTSRLPNPSVGNWRPVCISHWTYLVDDYDDGYLMQSSGDWGEQRECKLSDWLRIMEANNGAERFLSVQINLDSLDDSCMPRAVRALKGFRERGPGSVVEVQIQLIRMSKRCV
ncbi:MAG: hypothetical protein M1840_002207 [Geoglossum simile]|nr:MAG: hypothetical protein M1840_002207 [Geoglossum simile]